MLVAPLFSAFLIILSLAEPAAGSVGDGPEWPGFRGANGAGIAVSEGLPDALDPEASILWRTEIPSGYSSPVVSGEDLFVTGASGTKLSTLCLERFTGAVRWQRDVEFDGARPGANSPAAPSPVTDGEHVYVLFHSLGLVAYDKDGEELWQNELGPFNIPHGMATSPLLHGDALILLVDQDGGSYLAAFDKLTGKQQWRTARPGATHSYSTPALYVPEDGPAQVVVSGSLRITSYDASNGEPLWWVDGSAWQTKAVPVIGDGICYVNAFMLAPSEMGAPRMTQPWDEVLAERDADGDGQIAKSEWENDILHQIWFIFDLDDDGLLGREDYEYAVAAGRATGGLFAVSMDGRGDVTASHVKWTYTDRRGLPDCPSPLLVDDVLYVIKEGGLMTAFDSATGEVLKQERVGEPDRYFASPVTAAGKIVTASQSGQLAVVRAGHDWEVLSVNKLGEPVWSTPAIAGEQVFVRSEKALYCFQDLAGD